MEELHYESHVHWRNLQATWDEVQGAWHDQQSLTFADHFWQDFANQIDLYLRSADELLDLLEEVANEVRAVGQ